MVAMVIIYIVIGIIALIGLNWGMSSVGNLLQIIIDGAPQLIGLSMAIVGIYYMLKDKETKSRISGVIILILGAAIGMFSQFVEFIAIIFQNWIVLVIGMAMVFVYVLKREGVLE